MLTEVKGQESLWGRFSRVCAGCCQALGCVVWGGLVGAACGVLKPAAEWMLNAWERVYDNNAAFKGRMPVLIDIGAAAVVLYGSYVRFGDPAAYFFAATGSLLCIYGTFVGMAISLRQNQSLDKITQSIAKELWVWQIENNKVQQESVVVLQNSLSNNNPMIHRKSALKFLECIKGAGIGSISAALMPYVQLCKTILAAKRKWPLLINTGAINIYAWYVGTVFIGPSTSLLLFAGVEGALALYGLGKGAYVGYTQGASSVSTLLWEGGLTCKTQVDSSLDVVRIESFSPGVQISPPPIVLGEILPQAIPLPIVPVKICTWTYGKTVSSKSSTFLSLDSKELEHTRCQLRQSK